MQSRLRKPAYRLAANGVLNGAAPGFLILLMIAGAAGAKAPETSPRPSPRAPVEDVSRLAPQLTPRPVKRVAGSEATQAATFTAAGAVKKTAQAPDKAVSKGVLDGPLPQEPASGESGYALIDIKTGKMLEQRLAAQAFIPASVSKTPTALYALDALGPDYTFKTRVYAVGSIVNGVLKGDLYLVGSGDPVLDTSELYELAQAVAAKGIRKIDGVLLYDATALPFAEQIEPTQPVHAAYNPSISGLNLNFNRVLLKWERQKDKSYEVGLFAHSSRKVIEAETVAASVVPKDLKPKNVIAYQRLAGEAESWKVARKILTRRGSRWLPVQRPARYVAATFKALLQEVGVEAPREMLADVVPSGAMLIAEHESMPLKRILRGMLKYSTNLTAEAVGMQASRELGLSALSFHRSGAEMTKFMLARYGLTPQTTLFANHSGLASKSRISPGDMAQLMATVGADDAGFEAASWLLSRYKVRKLGGAEIRAKTGTMYFARGLSGLIACDSGKRLAFASFTNDIAKREKLDRTADPASTDKPRGGSYWLKRAQNIERQLLRNWVAKHC
ncbi:MAG: D-alanyl-D-alanine carboxypeptidase/D-alanyl-D-alanine-endopeptidase [Pseudomonadota bacterium]